MYRKVLKAKWHEWTFVGNDYTLVICFKYIILNGALLLVYSAWNMNIARSPKWSDGRSSLSCLQGQHLQLGLRCAWMRRLLWSFKPNNVKCKTNRAIHTTPTSITTYDKLMLQCTSSNSNTTTTNFTATTLLPSSLSLPNHLYYYHKY